ncbi:MAG: OadG family protein [Planctomycetales bacterium]|nr:OadG family protein [Planctomycetales bacterium]
MLNVRSTHIPYAIQGGCMILIGQAASGWANVSAEHGLGIAVTGMAIVFSALVFIVFFLMSLPHMLAALHEVFPEREHHSHAPPPTSSLGTAKVDEATAAAIAYAVHLHRQG